MKLYQELKINEVTNEKVMTVSRFIDIAIDNMNKGIVKNTEKFFDIFDMVCHSGKVEINIEDFDVMIERIKNGEDEYVVMTGKKYDPIVTVVREYVGKVEMKKSEYDAEQKALTEKKQKETTTQNVTPEQQLQQRLSQKAVANAISEKESKLREFNHEMRMQNDPTYRNAFMYNPGIEYLKNRQSQMTSPQLQMDNSYCSIIMDNPQMFVPQMQYHNTESNVEDDNYTDDIILSEKDVQYIYDAFNDDNTLDEMNELNKLFTDKEFKLIEMNKDNIIKVAIAKYKDEPEKIKLNLCLLYNVLNNNAYSYRVLKAAVNSCVDLEKSLIFKYLNVLVSSLPYEDEIVSKLNFMETEKSMDKVMDFCSEIFVNNIDSFMNKVMSAIKPNDIVGKEVVETIEEEVKENETVENEIKEFPQDVIDQLDKTINTQIQNQEIAETVEEPETINETETVEKEVKEEVAETVEESETINETEKIESFEDYTSRKYPDFEITDDVRDDVQREYEEYVIKITNKKSENVEESVEEEKTTSKTSDKKSSTRKSNKRKK